MSQGLITPHPTRRCEQRNKRTVQTLELLPPHTTGLWLLTARRIYETSARQGTQILRELISTSQNQPITEELCRLSPLTQRRAVRWKPTDVSELHLSSIYRPSSCLIRAAFMSGLFSTVNTNVIGSFVMSVSHWGYMAAYSSLSSQ